MAHVNHMKGQNVNLLLDLNNSGTFAVVAASSSCDFQVTAQTEDTQAKDDPGNGEFSAPSLSYYDWTGGNESYIVDFGFLYALLNKVINGDATVGVQFQTTGAYANQCVWKGTAIVTSLEITGAVDEKATVKISLDGASALEQGTFVTITPAAQIQEKITGKALMIAIRQNNVWDTILCSTSHTLTINVETQDSRDKDVNDKAVHKTVSSKSVTMSSESLIPASDQSSYADTGVDLLMETIMAGTLVHLAFGYYPGSVGHEVEDVNATKRSWGTPTSVLLQGDFIVSSLTPATGENQEDAKMSAEFQSVGKPNVLPPVGSGAE